MTEALGGRGVAHNRNIPYLLLREGVMGAQVSLNDFGNNNTKQRNKLERRLREIYQLVKWVEHDPIDRNDDDLWR